MLSSDCEMVSIGGGIISLQIVEDHWYGVVLDSTAAVACRYSEWHLDTFPCGV